MPHIYSRATGHKGVLEAQEIDHIADERTRARITIACVGLAAHKAVLEAEKIDNIEHALARRFIAIGIADRFGTRPSGDAL